MKDALTAVAYMAFIFAHIGLLFLVITWIAGTVFNATDPAGMGATILFFGGILFLSVLAVKDPGPGY